MTLLTTISEIEYAGLTGQDTFAYTFRVDNKTDMNVLLDSVPQAQGDFTMTGLGTPSGGDVILNVPLAGNATVLLFRDVPPTQEVDYQPFDAFPAETHEGALDKLTMLVQENESSINRSLRYPPGDTASAILPDLVTRAIKFLGFDASGDPVALAGTGGGDPNAVQKPIGAVTTGNLIEFDVSKNAVDSGSSITELTRYVGLAGSVIKVTEDPATVNSFSFISQPVGSIPALRQSGTPGIGVDLEGVVLNNQDIQTVSMAATGTVNANALQVNGDNVTIFASGVLTFAAVASGATFSGTAAHGLGTITNTDHMIMGANVKAAFSARDVVCYMAHGQSGDVQDYEMLVQAPMGAAAFTAALSIGDTSIGITGRNDNGLAQSIDVHWWIGKRV